MREFRSGKNQALRSAAYYFVKKARDVGALDTPDHCDACGASGRLHAHHEDYARPLEIEWLCASCHRTVHWEAHVPGGAADMPRPSSAMVPFGTRIPPSLQRRLKCACASLGVSMSEAVSEAVAEYVGGAP